jgi:alkylhydroperoxidase family enzyme
MSARLAPLESPFTDEVSTTLRRLMGGRDEVKPLALFRTLAHHDALLERFRQVGSALLSFGRIDPADREAVIHRTTARCGAAYEWGVHAALFAPAIDASDEWLRATWHGAADDPAFTSRQALLVAMCDELHDTATLSDPTWTALRTSYADDELVELVCLAGFYHLVSFACGAFKVEAEPWATAVPAVVG